MTCPHCDGRGVIAARRGPRSYAWSGGMPGRGTETHQFHCPWCQPDKMAEQVFSAWDEAESATDERRRADERDARRAAAAQFARGRARWYLPGWVKQVLMMIEAAK